jgi:hypothetical protein
MGRPRYDLTHVSATIGNAIGAIHDHKYKFLITKGGIAMDLFEELVMFKLTRNPHVFVSPQYSVMDDRGKEWSCHDFVMLNFRDRTVSVVEVNTAADPKDLEQKVADRQKQWLTKLRSQLKGNAVVDASWALRVDVFVRHQAVPNFKEKFGHENDVGIHNLDEIGFPWHWEWSPHPAD